MLSLQSWHFSQQQREMSKKSCGGEKFEPFAYLKRFCSKWEKEMEPLMGFEIQIFAVNATKVKASNLIEKQNRLSFSQIYGYLKPSLNIF